MNEKISQLVDGEANDPAIIDGLCADPRAREAWGTYHLIGDALRGTRELGSDFAARVAWRLEDEPTVLAPKRARPEPKRWIALPIAASFAAVALVGWMAFAPQPQAPVPAPVVAKAEPARPAMVPLTTATNDYLLAHQGFSPRLALQGMAPYVITVSEQPRK